MRDVAWRIVNLLWRSPHVKGSLTVGDLQIVFDPDYATAA
jgi:hypothetical protein